MDDVVRDSRAATRDDLKAVPSAQQSLSGTVSQIGVAKTAFGSAGDKAVDLYTLTNRNGLTVKVTTYGATITSLWAPDRYGKMGDVVLGFDNIEGYVADSPYFGATIGRVANRIRNAAFVLEGQTYNLAANNGSHHLHGGNNGWDKLVWLAEVRDSSDGPSVKLTHVSPDGEEGYPGTVTAAVTYTLTDANELRVEMEAATNRTTIVNMAHHTYWNLSADGTRAITDHELLLHADSYTPGDPVVPVGVEVPVRGTAFDFTMPKPIGRDLAAAGGDPVGFDHNFIVNGEPSGMRPVATLRDPRSGRVLTLAADQPGVQFYSGNFLDGKAVGKNGEAYAQYTGLCLETQKFPNATNVPAWRDQVVLKRGDTYKHTMIHTFTVD